MRLLILFVLFTCSLQSAAQNNLMKIKKKIKSSNIIKIEKSDLYEGIYHFQTNNTRGLWDDRHEKILY
ncbi:MAG: hypothetical protein R3345_10965, partial [Fulvivirga sp.]|nr:hypothetical protein [Fulvivirga sp.]